MSYEKAKRETDDRLDNLIIEKGDIFNEMLSFFIYVCDVRDDQVKVVERHGSELKEVFWVTKKDLRDRLSYKSIPGYWVIYSGKDEKRCEEILTYYNEVFSKELGIIE